MKKTTSKTIIDIMIITSLFFIMISCTKNQQNDLQAENQSLVSQSSAGTPTLIPLCSPIPTDLLPPAENKLTFQTFAKGVQIYQARRSATDPNVFVWVNTAPSANLYAKPDFTNQVGIHYAGPSWEFTKGPFKNDKVVGSKLKVIMVDASAIPWLLLKAVDSLSSPGNKITYIQRVCTAGGLAPSTPATESNLGQTDSIPYNATYLFYTKD